MVLYAGNRKGVNKMIILNGKKFAKNDKEFTNSLFETGGTCDGYYKVTKNKIFILDVNKKIVGVITKNKVMAKATKLENGKYWYSYGDISIIGEYENMAQQYEDIKNAFILFKEEL